MRVSGGGAGRGGCPDAAAAGADPTRPIGILVRVRGSKYMLVQFVRLNLSDNKQNQPCGMR